MAKSKQPSLNLTGINAAIIMDGNGRWAKKNSLNVTSGHERGVEVVRKIVESAAKAQLESLSLYAFSTENWSRPKKEILGIKKLIISAIDSQVPELISQKVRLNFCRLIISKLFTTDPNILVISSCKLFLSNFNMFEFFLSDFF